MYKEKIELTTLKDVQEFVAIVSKINGNIYLKDGNDFCVSAKSIMGAIAALEWNSLYCYSETDISYEIYRFIVD